MAREIKKDKSDQSELEPAIAKPAQKKDQVSEVIGEVGRWQLEKILIVFLAAAPGMLLSLMLHYNRIPGRILYHDCIPCSSSRYCIMIAFLVAPGIAL